MNTKFVVVLSTLLGTASGFACGWLLAKKRFEHLADEEVASVKKSLTEYYEHRDSNAQIKSEPKETSSINKKEGIVNKVSDPKQTKTLGNYTDYGKQYRSQDADNRVINVDSSGERIFGKNAPYVISPKDYNSSSNKSVTLWYTDDNILCDEEGNEIRNYGDMIGGPEVFSHFGEYEEDSIYVRNDVTGIDYEILLDHRLYHKSTPTNIYDIPEDDDD